MKYADSSKPRLRGFNLPTILAPVRVVCFLAFACVLVTLPILRNARADVSEALWVVGPSIMEFPGVPREAVRHLHLNGIGVSFRTQTVAASLTEVLTHYEATCGTVVSRLAARNREAGYVACVELGNPAPDRAELARRFVVFAETLDLKDIGSAHYVFARRADSDGGSATFLLTMWVDSSFSLRALLPRAGADAPGSDLDAVPRPPGSRRFLSVREAHRPSGIVSYEVPTALPAQLESFYRSQLPRYGWRIIERHPAESVQVDGVHLISAEKVNRHITVLSHLGSEQRTVLTILASEPS